MHNTHAILEFFLFTKYWFCQITSVLFVAIRKNVVRINGTSLFDFFVQGWAFGFRRLYLPWLLFFKLLKQVVTFTIVKN
jgi:hypothetical protein